MRYYLLNAVQFGAQTLRPGKLVDDALYPVAALQAAGATLWPAGDARVTSAAAHVAAKQSSSGINDAESSAVMVAAVLSSIARVPLDPDPTLTQATWFVDPTNSSLSANDANDGLTASTPLLTHAELERRRFLASGGGPFPILQTTTVTFLSAPSNPDADPVNLDVVKVSDARLVYVGFLTTQRTGTFTGTTPASAAQLWNVTDGAVVSWSADAKRLYTDLTTNARAWVQADLGAGAALTSEPMLRLLKAPTAENDFASLAPPLTAPGNDAYSVSTLCRVRLGSVKIEHRGTAGAGVLATFAATFFQFDFAKVSASGSTSEIITVSGNDSLSGSYYGVGFAECRFEPAVETTATYCTYTNCYFDSTVFVVTAGAVVIGGVVNSLRGDGSAVFADGGTLVLGSLTDASGARSAAFSVGLISAGPASVNLLHGEVSGTRFKFGQISYAGQKQVRGTCSKFLQLSGGAEAQNTAGQWVAVFTGTATVAFGSFDGLTSVWTFLTATNVHSAPIALTAANLDATQAGGGFGGFAVNPQTGTVARTLAT